MIVMLGQELVLSAGKEANQNHQNKKDDDDESTHTGREG